MACPLRLFPRGDVKFNEIILLLVEPVNGRSEGSAIQTVGER